MGLRANSNNSCGLDSKYPAFTKVDNFIRVLNLMKTRRVDFIGLGDSNQIKSGVHGWEHGWQKALSDKFDMYATALIPAGTTLFNVGYKYDSRDRWGTTVLSTGNPEQEKYMDDGILTTSLTQSAFVKSPDTASGSSNIRGGIQIFSDCPIDISGNIQYDFYYVTEVSGGGTFEPILYQEPFDASKKVTDGLISTQTGAYTMTKKSLQYPNDPLRNAQNGVTSLRGGFSGSVGSGITGSVFCAYIRAINQDRSKGFGYTTQYFFSGAGMRDMANAIISADDAYLTHIYSTIRNDQLAKNPYGVTILFTIHLGTGDFTENGISKGTRAITPSSLPEAFGDNCQAIIDRILGIWTLNNWDLDEVNFLLVGSHPQSEPDNTQLISYRKAMSDLCSYNQRCSSVDINQLIPFNIGVEKGYYNPSDVLHVLQLGFEAICTEIINLSCV